MGNTQSTTNPNQNWANFEIIGKEKHTGRVLRASQEVSFIRFHVDPAITYHDGQFNRIDVGNCYPFKNFRIGDILRIDLNVVSQADSTQRFNDTDVVTRGSWGTKTMRKHRETMGKYTIGAGLVLADQICPTVGEYMTNSTHVVGELTELAGNLSGNKDTQRIGRVLNSGAQIGSSISGLRGEREDHVEDCLSCNSEILKKMAERNEIWAKGLEVAKDVAKIVIEGKKPFFED